MVIHPVTRLALTCGLTTMLAACFDFQKDFQAYCDETGACVCETPGIEAKLAFTPGLVQTTAGACTPVHVKVLDTNNCLTPLRAPTGTRVAFTGLPETLELYASADCSGTRSEGGSLDLPAGAREATFSLRGTRPGEPTLGVNAVLDSELFTSQLGVTIVAGPAARLSLIGAESAFTAGSCGGPILAQVQDAVGNVIPQNVPISASTTSDAGTFYSWVDADGGACGGPLDEVQASAGMLRLGYRDDRAGSQRVSLDLPGIDGGLALSAEVSPGAVTQLAPLHGSGELQVGVGRCAAVTVELRDAWGNPVIGPPSVIAEELKATLSAEGDAQLFAAGCKGEGALQLQLTIDGARATAFLSGQGAQRGAIQIVDEDHPSLSTNVPFALREVPSLAAQGLGLPVLVGACRRVTLRVEPETAAPLAAGRSVQLTSRDADVRFFPAGDTGCTTPLPGNRTAFPAAGGDLVVHLRSEKAGKDRIQAILEGEPEILPLSEEVAFLPGDPVAVLVSAGGTLTAGQCGHVLVGGRDAFGNATRLLLGPSILVGNGGQDVAWFLDAECSQPVLSVGPLPLTAGLATLGAKRERAGTVPVSFLVPGLESAHHQLNVVAGPPASIALDKRIKEVPIGDVRPFTATLLDRYGNEANAREAMTLKTASPPQLAVGVGPKGGGGDPSLPAGASFVEFQARVADDASPGELPFTVGVASGLDAGQGAVLACVGVSGVCTPGGSGCCSGTTCSAQGVCVLSP